MAKLTQSQFMKELAVATEVPNKTAKALVTAYADLAVKEGIRPPALVVIGDVVGIGAQITELTRGVPVTPGRQTG